MLIDSLALRAATFELEDMVDSTFYPHHTRVLQYLVRRLGISIVQRPQLRSGRRSRDIDFYSPNNLICGIVLSSRYEPGHSALVRGWFVSDRNLERIVQGFSGGHSYGWILYLFANGDLYFIDACVAAQSTNHVALSLPMSNGQQRAGVHIKEEAFIRIGSVLDDGAGPLDIPDITRKMRGHDDGW